LNIVDVIMTVTKMMFCIVKKKTVVEKYHHRNFIVVSLLLVPQLKDGDDVWKLCKMLMFLLRN